MENIRESGLTFDPKFDANALLTAVITDSDSGEVLMVGHMNAEAIQKTLDSGTVYFFSRSRQKLWQKGETSGNFLLLVDFLIDCDQDAVWIKARPDGPTCHTGAASCFYRRVTKDGLERI
jgi:phosphoribosyl-AMP cyclohydrolase